MHVAASSDHLRLPPFAHYAPATRAGAQPAGPPPGHAGPNQTSLGTTVVARERTIHVKATHRAAPFHTARGVSFVPDGSTTISHLMTTPMLGNRVGLGSRLPARQRNNKNNTGRRSIQLNKFKHAMTFIGCSDHYLAGISCLASTSFSRKPALHGRLR
ncbi:hypothetical protein F511_43670 [Dorcoceras hygrometricum]|uniref:Uncharacterized protein n=1 Tax=Dorcoceras hygrometricum TaxID=472368 RepID=A0A2Z7BB61_9LAMI|nr:hypothetical protein F511_43670 [Dorcoceras hygrometricum]